MLSTRRLPSMDEPWVAFIDDVSIGACSASDHVHANLRRARYRRLPTPSGCVGGAWVTSTGQTGWSTRRALRSAAGRQVSRLMVGPTWPDALRACMVLANISAARRHSGPLRLTLHGFPLAEDWPRTSQTLGLSGKQVEAGRQVWLAYCAGDVALFARRCRGMARVLPALGRARSVVASVLPRRIRDTRRLSHLDQVVLSSFSPNGTNGREALTTWLKEPWWSDFGADAFWLRVLDWASGPNSGLLIERPRAQNPLRWRVSLSSAGVALLRSGEGGVTVPPLFVGGRNVYG